MPSSCLILGIVPANSEIICAGTLYTVDTDGSLSLSIRIRIWDQNAGIVLQQGFSKFAAEMGYRANLALLLNLR